MMTDEQALLQSIIDNPDDDFSRLVFADWLEENGQADRAEFIRVQVAIARGDGDPIKCTKCDGAGIYVEAYSRDPVRNKGSARGRSGYTVTTQRKMPFQLEDVLCDRCNASGVYIDQSRLRLRERELFIQNAHEWAGTIVNADRHYLIGRLRGYNRGFEIAVHTKGVMA